MRLPETDPPPPLQSLVTPASNCIQSRATHFISVISGLPGGTEWADASPQKSPEWLDTFRRAWSPTLIWKNEWTPATNGFAPAPGFASGITPTPVWRLPIWARKQRARFLPPAASAPRNLLITWWPPSLPTCFFPPPPA